MDSEKCDRHFSTFLIKIQTTFFNESKYKLAATLMKKKSALATVPIILITFKNYTDSNYCKVIHHS